MILVYLFEQNMSINIWIIDRSTHKYKLDELRFIFVMLIIILV